MMRSKKRKYFWKALSKGKIETIAKVTGADGDITRNEQINRSQTRGFQSKLHYVPGREIETATC